MTKRLPFAATVLCAALGAGVAHSANLFELYSAANKVAPQLMAAQASLEASREQVNMAEAQLWPVLGVSAQQARNNTEQSQGSFNKTSDYDATGYSINLRQPLFRATNYYGYRSAESQFDRARQDLKQETQQTAARLAEAYFGCLTAQDKLLALQADILYLAGERERATRAFQLGEGTKTEIEEAGARHDAAIAREIQAKTDIAVFERNLSAMVGFTVRAADLAPIEPDRLNAGFSLPIDLEEAIKTASINNPEVAAVRFDIETANREVDKATSGHYPTLDLVASRAYSDSESNNTIGNKYYTDSIGLQLTVPLYSGGGVQAGVRKAVAGRERMRYQLASAEQQISVATAKEYGAMRGSQAKVQALIQAVRSAEQALAATEKSIRAGTRTRVDVLNARQQLTAAKVDLAEARNAFAMSFLRLQGLMGQLDEAGIQVANGWLVNAPR